MTDTLGNMPVTPSEDARSKERQRRRELGAYLRERRSALAPEQVGVIRQPRRRVAGLRRYEVAEIAAVSDTLYTWLEQGRDIRVSADALDSIARALRLDDHARRHVRRLAGVPEVNPEPADALGPSYGELLEKMLPYPACTTTVAFDLVDWNCAFGKIFGDPTLTPPEQRNLVWAMFLDESPRRIRNWETAAHGVLARFRFESGHYPDEPRFGELIHALTEASEDFRRVWSAGTVRPFADRILTIEHPVVGDLNFLKFQMRSVDQSRLILTVHQAADPGTAQRLENLMSMNSHRAEST